MVYWLLQQLQCGADVESDKHLSARPAAARRVAGKSNIPGWLVTLNQVYWDVVDCGELNSGHLVMDFMAMSSLELYKINFLVVSARLLASK